MTRLDALLVNWPIFRHVVNMLPGVILAAALFLCLRPVRKRKLQVKNLYSSPLRETALLLFWMFGGGLAVLTLTPRWFSWISVLLYGPPGYPFFRPGTINLILFRTFVYDLPYIILGNVVMFLPFGLFPALLWRGYRWWSALVCGLCISGLIEFWQFFIGRASDIDDLMLNTLGALWGFWLALIFRRMFPGTARRLQVEHIS